MSRTIAPSGSQARLILIGTALLLTLGMGMRQSFGLFLAPVTHDLAVTAADFTLALAVQNIVWGLSQALVGVDRRPLRSAHHDDGGRGDLRRWPGHHGCGPRRARADHLRRVDRRGLVMHGDVIGNDRMCACGFGGAAEHDARSCLRGRIARHPRGAARHPGPARARAVADRGAVFRADGGRDAARCLLGWRRRQDTAGTARQRPPCARCSARPCGTGRFL